MYDNDLLLFQVRNMPTTDDTLKGIKLRLPNGKIVTLSGEIELYVSSSCTCVDLHTTKTFVYKTAPNDDGKWPWVMIADCPLGERDFLHRQMLVEIVRKKGGDRTE